MPSAAIVYVITLVLAFAAGGGAVATIQLFRRPAEGSHTSHAAELAEVAARAARIAVDTIQHHDPPADGRRRSYGPDTSEDLMSSYQAGQRSMLPPGVAPVPAQAAPRGPAAVPPVWADTGANELHGPGGMRA